MSILRKARGRQMASSTARPFPSLKSLSSNAFATKRRGARGRGRNRSSSAAPAQAGSAPASPRQEPVEEPVHIVNELPFANDTYSPAEPSSPVDDSSSPAATPSSPASSVPASPVLSPASAPSSPALSSTPEPTPSYTEEEKQMVSILDSVSQRLTEMECSVPPLRGEITNFLARACLQHWRPGAFSFDAKAIRLQHWSLHYRAGMIDELSLQQTFRLDSIQTDNAEIRRQRKALVQRGHQLSKISLELREQIKRYEKLLPPELKEEDAQTEQQQEQQQEQDAEEQAMTDAESQSDAEAREEEEQMVASEKDAMDMEEERQPVQAEQKPKQKKTKTKKQHAEAGPSSAAPPTALQQKYASLRLPTYSGPSFHARVLPSNGSLLIEADLAGILSSDIAVVPDLARRTLTLRGVRLPERRRSVPQDPFGHWFGYVEQPRPQPYGHFSRSIDLDELDPHRQLDLSRVEAVVNAQHALQIRIPRKPAPAPQRVQQQHPMQQRRPAVFQSGFESPSDDDEADYYSSPFHASPFASHYAPRRADPYRAAASPFFGFW